MKTVPNLLLGAALLLAACADDAPVTASNVSYSTATSGLTTATVQGALDELAARETGGTDALEPRVVQVEAATALLTGRVDGHDTALAALQQTVGDHQQALDGQVAPAAKDVGIEDPGLGAESVQDAIAALYAAQQQEKAAREQALAAMQVAVTSLEETVAAQATALGEREDRITQLETDLEAKWKQPRPCPDGMVATSDSTCMEATLREDTYLIGATGECNYAGRRLCSMDELMGPCSTLQVTLEDPIAKVAEWTGDAVDVLGENFQIAATTIGGPSCKTGKIVSDQHGGTGVDDPQDVNQLQYPYRCCVTR